MRINRVVQKYLKSKGLILYDKIENTKIEKYHNKMECIFRPKIKNAVKVKNNPFRREQNPSYLDELLNNIINGNRTKSELENFKKELSQSEKYSFCDADSLYDLIELALIAPCGNSNRVNIDFTEILYGVFMIDENILRTSDLNYGGLSIMANLLELFFGLRNPYSYGYYPNFVTSIDGYQNLYYFILYTMKKGVKWYIGIPAKFTCSTQIFGHSVHQQGFFKKFWLEDYNVRFRIIDIQNSFIKMLTSQKIESYDEYGFSKLQFYILDNERYDILANDILYNNISLFNMELLLKLLTANQKIRRYFILLLKHCKVSPKLTSKDVFWHFLKRREVKITKAIWKTNYSVLMHTVDENGRNPLEASTTINLVKFFTEQFKELKTMNKA